MLLITFNIFHEQVITLHISTYICMQDLLKKNKHFHACQCFEIIWSDALKSYGQRRNSLEKEIQVHCIRIF